MVEGVETPIPLKFEVSFDPVAGEYPSGEYPSGGHGDDISYTSCTMAEDATVTRIEHLDGPFKGFFIEQGEDLINFTDNIVLDNGSEFFEFIVECIEENL